MRDKAVIFTSKVVCPPLSGAVTTVTDEDRTLLSAAGCGTGMEAVKGYTFARSIRKTPGECAYSRKAR